MKCLECEELLQRRLDGEVVASEALEQHLSECAACREQYQAALCLLEGLKTLPKPEARSTFAQVIAAEVLQDRRRRRDKLRRRVALTAALAASVLFILFAAYYWLPRSEPVGPQPQLPVAKKNEPKLPETPKRQDYPKTEEPKNPLEGLPDRWVDTTRDHAKVLQVAMSLDAIDNLPATDKLTALNPGVREASQEVSDGVRTVTRNARKAFDFFARELPMPEMPD